MKQSGQVWLPVIGSLEKFETIVSGSASQKFIAHVDQANPAHLKEAPSNSDYLVLIGPEGDFTTNEVAIAVEKGFSKVSLGTNTLRTETAGLAACHILNLINS